jgi:hypothetical protein
LEESNLEEDRETDGKSSLTIDLLLGLKHSVLVEVEEEVFKMYLYISTYSKIRGRARAPT